MTTIQETAIGAAFGRAGLNLPEVRLRQAADEALRKHHGNIERAMAMFDRVLHNDHALLAQLQREYLSARSELLALGHGPLVHESVGHGLHAESERPLPASGHSSYAANGSQVPRAVRGHPIEGADPQVLVADGQVANGIAPSPIEGADPHFASVVDHARLGIAPSPNPSRRGLASIESVNGIVRRSLFEITKTSDGRPWGKIAWRELAGMERDGEISREIIKHGKPPNTGILISEFLTERQFERIVSKVRR